MASRTSITNNSNILNGYPSDVVRDNLNRNYNSLFFKDGDRVMPFVCLSCDAFIKAREYTLWTTEDIKKKRHYLELPTHYAQSIPESLKEEYSVQPANRHLFAGRTDDADNASNNNEEAWWKALSVSPRSPYIKNRTSEGFCVCRACNDSLISNERPYFSISNNWLFGETPDVLKELTEVELGVLTPVRVYGYCYAYTGGPHKQMKGSLSFFKMKHESLARSVMHFDVLNLTNNVVVMLYGKVTEEQRNKLRMKNKIRTEKVMRAMEWLVQYNSEWKQRNIKLDSVRQMLLQKDPVLIDDSIQVASGVHNGSNNNIEDTETFKVFFPDGDISPITGGQENIDELRGLIHRANSAGYNFELRNNIYTEAAVDYKDNCLVNTCLLQYPYGRGGLEDEHLIRCKRMRDNLVSKKTTDILAYSEHMMNLSMPQFHRSLFSLIIFNLKMKQLMIRKACLQLRYSSSAEALAQNLTSEAISTAIDARRRGLRVGPGENRNGELLLSTVDAVVGGVPHTNQATRRARRNAEAIMHQFGLPSIFLTVTPDDDNSYLLQVLSSENNDADGSIGAPPGDRGGQASGGLHTIPEKSATPRATLRLKYPGLASMAYDILIEIVIEQVIGWDISKNKQSDTCKGLFGEVEAFTVTTEEQGRSTLHGHMLIWLKDFNRWREDLHSNIELVRNQAVINIQNVVDCVSSNKLISRVLDKHHGSRGVFKHDCIPTNRNLALECVDDQRLRDLRHKIGCQHFNNEVMYCPNCAKRFSNDELMELFLQNHVGMTDLSSYNQVSIKSLKQKTLDYQKSDRITPTLEDVCTIDACYNCHRHQDHGCFGKVGGSRKRSLGCDCRFRLPRPPCKKTKVEPLTEEKLSWYKFTGEMQERHIYDVVHARGKYDVYQNNCCPAISHSKLTCNTNIGVLMNGPSGVYCFKYNTKDTQEDDVEEYDALSAAMKKTLSRNESLDISDTSTSVKRILSASFAHSNQNVISAPMASYLVRNGSRFIFSHETIWCPLRDIRRILHDENVGGSIAVNGSQYFFVNSALHYLCRPKELEHLSPKVFYESYEVVKQTRSNGEHLLDFCNEGVLQHPSYNTNTGKFAQGVRKRDRRHLIKIFQWDFPDAASFNGDILSDDYLPMSSLESEKYAMLCLMLLTPYRVLSDIKKDGESYTQLLKQALCSERNIITAEDREYLQNIQDTKSNDLRFADHYRDELCRTTEMFSPPKGCELDAMNCEEENNEEEDCHDSMLNDEEVDLFLGIGDTNVRQYNNIEELDFESIKRCGGHEAAYSNIASVHFKKDSQDRVAKVVEVEECPLTPDVVDEDYQDEGEAGLLADERDGLSQVIYKKEIIELIGTRNSRVKRSFHDITNRGYVHVTPANGTARSIIDWADKACLDVGQKRAFEIICSHFVLTIYRRCEDEESFIHGAASTRRVSSRPTAFNKEEKYLHQLHDGGNGMKRNNQLIAFLHGPAGCGKTTVIDLIIEYAREYCDKFANFKFTSRTIVVTALTGVAATLLNGETVHSALHLNRKRPIEAEQIELWKDTMLVVIDEISFASNCDISNINNKLGVLKQNAQAKFGGIDIIFSGDFRQLEPIVTKGEDAKPIYESDCIEFKDWVNCYLELDGKHRFRNDREWGNILSRFRNGEVTENDIERINERVVLDSTDVPDHLPSDLRYVTYYNKDRDAINTALFEKRAENMTETYGSTDDMIMVLSDELEIRRRDSKYQPIGHCCWFWKHCGEHDIKLPRSYGRMDPVLKLYKGCELMLTTNEDVKNGKANGTGLTFDKIILKHGEVVQGKVNFSKKVSVQYVFASQVKHLIATHKSDRVRDKTIALEPKKRSFTTAIRKHDMFQIRGCKQKEEVKMKALQFSVVVNNTTTGHKLQGCGVPSLFVHNWYTRSKNWAYVVLSRVKERSGLFLRSALNAAPGDFDVDQSLANMIKKMKETRTPRFLSDDEYDAMMAGRVLRL